MISDHFDFKMSVHWLQPVRRMRRQTEQLNTALIGKFNAFYSNVGSVSVQKENTMLAWNMDTMFFKVFQKDEENVLVHISCVFWSTYPS